MRQFEETKPAKTHRWKEAISSGNFIQVKKNVPLVPEAGKQKKVQEEQLDDQSAEREMVANQLYWTSFLQSLFQSLLGVLAGSSILHSTIILGLQGWGDPTMFLALYTQFSVQINIMFLLIGNIVFVLGVTMALIYQAKYDEKQRSLDEDRDQYVSKRNVATLLSIVCGISFLILLFLPKYTNTLYYKGAEMEDKETVILSIYVIYLVVGLLYVISFLVGSCNQ